MHAPSDTCLPVRRILAINPNTNPEVTGRIRALFDGTARASSGLQIEVVNPSTGPFSVETAADRTAATAAVVDLIAADRDRDAYILACFDDIAVAETRPLVGGAVFSMAQAAIESAAATGQPFTVVTTVTDQVPTIEALVEKYANAALGSVVACSVGVAEAAARTGHAEARLDRQIRAAIGANGAHSIVLGSGAYAGRADELEKRHGVRFIDGLTAAVERLVEE